MFYKQVSYVMFVLIALGSSCKSNNVSDETDSDKVTLFSKLSSSETNINFENTIANTDELNIFEYRNFYNGGGVGIGDINNDGLAEVVFTANQGQNRIYLNQGDFSFKDITSESGLSGKNKWSTGVVMVDVNADGWLDIYICNAGIVSGDDQKNELYINNKDLTFTEAAEQYNLDDNGFTTHTSFFDYDKDGDLDAYILNNSFVPVSSLGYSNKRELRSEDWDIKEKLKGGGDKLLRNDNNYFVDVSEEAGIYGSLIGFGLGITVGDITGDNWPDIYISNDFYERDYLYVNQKDGTFSEEIEKRTSHISLSSMGADLSDLNNDGNPDIFVTDMLIEADDRRKETSDYERYDLFHLKQRGGFHNQYMQNTLQLNNGNQSFSEIAYYSGVAMTDWSWGALLFDMDNDGLKDIFVSNGIYHDVTNQDFINFFANDIIDDLISTGKKVPVDSIIKRMPINPVSNYAFKNSGDLKFSNVVDEWGFDEKSFSNGSAIGDLDNDGDLDLVVNNVNQSAFIYRNEANQLIHNNYIQLKLKGKGSNSFGVGSQVNVYVDDDIIHQQLQPSKGFQSSSDYILTFGIGSRSKVDSIEVIWPDDSRHLRKAIPINQLLNFDQRDATEFSQFIRIENATLLSKLPSQSLQKHEENSYVDFDEEGMIYKMLSKEGPTISVNDINADGLEDLFIGGAQGRSGQVYIQNSSGFDLVTSEVLAADALFEDSASSLFDVDGDGDIDLLVGSGGNQVLGAKNDFKLRLYLNDGHLTFQKSTLQMPTNFYNTSVIRPGDFDSDGDMDVFVGSRSIPGLYGIDPKHFLLENDGLGNFKNVLTENIIQSEALGLITDAQWIDIDSNDEDDLVVTQEWGSPMIYLNRGGKLSPLVTNLNELKGWWKSVKAVDIDKDGDIDFVFANRGTNSIYNADSVSVHKMFLNDFDNNGSVDQIFTSTVNGEDVPIHAKNELTDQIPILKKSNLQYSEYSKKSIADLIPDNKLERAIKKVVNISESIIAFNNGDNSFSIQKLPYQAQFSCINDVEIIDLNKDGNLDIVFGGNDFSLKPQFSQLDANHGGILLGNGGREFKWIKYSDSGFFVKGVINSIGIINGVHSDIIVGINNDTPQLFRTLPNIQI